MTSSTCCFLTCIQVSLEAGKVVWYSHLLFPLLWMNMSSHCPLASMVSEGKSAVNLVEARSYMISIFFLAAFKIFSLSLACSSLIIICTGVNPLSFSLEFLGGVKCSFLSNLKKNASHCFFYYYFHSLPTLHLGLPGFIPWYISWCFTALWDCLFSFIFFFFLFVPPADNPSWPIVRFADSFFHLLRSSSQPS